MISSPPVLTGVIVISTAIATWIIFPPSGGRSAKIPILSSLTAAVLPDPDKLGWMDDSPLTRTDRARIAEISSTAWSGITRRDFELLRQDRRRARAAYPGVDEDDLYRGTWLSVALPARVPDSFCTSGNSQGTEVDGKWYLDGSCYVFVVDQKYPERADAATTRRVLTEQKDAERRKRARLITKWGHFTSWGGSDGPGRIGCYPDPLPSDQEADDLHVPGKCVVILGATKYVFPFVASEWVDHGWMESLDDLRKLPSFAQSSSGPYEPVEKPWVRRDGLLKTGERCATGRLCWSQWNGDGYDNKDIGPDMPAGWVLQQPFGTAYLPAPGNGETRSVPGKPWWVIVSWYGATPQASGGWTETEAKALLPQFLTSFSIGVPGQDSEALNQGNLREARATQVPPGVGVLVLTDRATPIAPPRSQEAAHCVQGGTLWPGESCHF